MTRLLLALDLYDLPAGLLPAAITWTTRLGGTLDLLYSGGYDDVIQFVHDPAVRRMLAAEADKARVADREELSRLLDGIPAENRGTALVCDGDPAERVAELEGDYDAILVGTHGRTGLARALLGSVAERLVRTTTRPVLVLRTHPEPDAKA